MITPNQRVDKIYENGELSTAFGFATNIGTGLNPQYFFSEIYAPVKIPTSEGLPDEWTYVNIGVDNAYLAQIYNTYYSVFHLIRDNSLKLFPFIQGVFLKNKYKYMRMIELQGYTFNPLWNVDADERYAHIERHGDRTDTDTHSYDVTTTHDTDVDVTNWSRDFSDTAPANYDTKSNTKGQNVDNRKNSTRQEEDNQDTLNVVYTAISGAEADDAINPLGFDATGDFSHVERHIRQGNIGVTKSTELLEDAMNFVRFNLIQEFFNDINEVIMIGVTAY